MRAVPAISIGLVAAAAFGVATPLSKILLGQLNVLQMAGLLYIGSAIGTAPVFLRKRLQPPVRNMSKRNALRIGGAVILGGILGPLLFLIGLNSAPASSVSLWLNLELAATAVIGVLLFKDHLSGAAWMSVAGVIVAGVLTTIPQSVSGVAAAFWITAACICWGFDNHLSALVDSISPGQFTFIKGSVAGTINLTLGFAFEQRLPDPEPLLMALGLGVVSYGASIALYVTAAQHLGATRSQIVFASAPFFGAGLSVIILSERLSPLHLAAAGTLVVSIVVMRRARHAHLHEHLEMEYTHFHTHRDIHHDHEHDESTVRARVHIHRHRHAPLIHDHPHVPDIHHRHEHVE